MTTKKRRKLLALCLSLAMLVSIIPLQVTPAQPVKAAGYGISNPRTDKNGVSTWDCIYFGNYYQSNSTTKEPIKWRVLSVKGDDAFLLADKNLDCQPYNTEWKDVTWETCTLRNWLNNDFYNTAFSAAEKSAIKTTLVVNEDNPEYGTEGGNNTNDKLYLLSLREVMTPSYGFPSDLDASKTRETKHTEYTKEQGAWTSESEEYRTNGWWWLRSPGADSIYASDVGTNGYIDNYGGLGVAHTNYAVRPALHLNLSSVSVWSYAGQVTSDGAEYGSPTSSTCSKIPLFSTYKNKLASFYRYHSFLSGGLEVEKALKENSFTIPGLSTTNVSEDTGTGLQYLNNNTYVPQGICRMGNYILISAYQESYKGNKWDKKEKKWVQDWRPDYDSVIYVLDGSTFQYRATLVLPYDYHNGGIAFDGYNVWLTNTKGAKEVYYIKKSVVESKIAEVSSDGPYSARFDDTELGKAVPIQNKPSCLTWHDGKLWVAENGGTGKICGYTVTKRNTAKPVLTSYKCDTITTATILGMKASAAKCINGIAFDGSDLYLSVSSGRQGAVKHIIRAKKIGRENIGSSYRVAKKVLVPDMSEELMIEGNTLYCVFESGANHYNGSYGKGPNIITERVLAFDKKLWED